MAITYIGSTFAISAGAPATEDYAGLSAKSYTLISECMMAPGTGDKSERAEYTTLTGRLKRLNGAKDGGENEFSYIYMKTDPGQIIVRANAGTNNVVCIRVTDQDGESEYVVGLIADLTKPSREASTIKSQSGVFLANSETFVSP